MKIYCISILALVLFVKTVCAQNTKGIHMQAIARNEQGVIMPNKQITLRLSILNDTIQGNIIYQEIKSVTSNVLGLFFVDMGADEPGKVITGNSFNQIKWDEGEHYLQVEVDPNNALTFTTIGLEKINYVPLALYADKANTVTSIIPIELGGTGVTNIKDLSKLLNIDKINNTPDSLKPISIAVNIGLNDKLKKSDTVSLSNRINSKLNSVDTIKLSNRINQKLNLTDTISLSNRINSFPRIDTNSLSNRINSKITTGNVSINDITSGLGYIPVKNNYGQFYDTGRQTTVVSTATAVKFTFQQLANKTTITNNTAGNPTRITITDAGVYHLNYTLQFIKADSGNDELNIWIRRNGSAYPNTNLINTIQGSGVKNIFSGSYYIELGTNDYIELFYSIKNINSNLVGTPSTTVTPSRPATPSAFINMHAVN